jgi:hypothetical protein
VLVYCLGPEKPATYHERCHHNGRLNLADLPSWDWTDISAHLRCTVCGTVGYVDTGWIGVRSSTSARVSDEGCNPLDAVRAPQTR